MDQKNEVPTAITLEESQRSLITDHIRALDTPTDFNIICGPTVFKAHKAMFAASSNYLLELFIKQPNGYFNFLLDDVQPIDVDNLLTYVYQAKVTVNPSKAPGFLRAAKQLRIDALMQDACKMLEVTEPAATKRAIEEPEMKLKASGTGRAVKKSRANPKEPKIDLQPAVPIKKSNENFKVPLPKGPRKPKLIPSEGVIIGPTVLRSAVEPVVNVRGILGRPILSSTKLDSSNPLIPDKMKPDAISKYAYCRNETRIFKSDKVEDNKTFVIPDTPDQLPLLGRGRRRAVLAKVQPQVVQPFCVTDLVKQIEKKSKNQQMKSTSLEDEPQFLAAVTKPNPPKTQGIKGALPKGRKIKKAPLKRLKKKMPQNPMSITEHHQLTVFRPLDKKTTVGVANLVQATDDSTDCVQMIGEIRKKIPIEKRRRVPASTRPLQYNTTTTSISLRKSLRVKHGRALITRRL